MAWLTVGRLAPVSSARSRSDGSRVPSGSRAAAISRSTWPAIFLRGGGRAVAPPGGLLVSERAQFLPDRGAVRLLRPGHYRSPPGHSPPGLPGPSKFLRPSRT